MKNKVRYLGISNRKICFFTSFILFIGIINELMNFAYIPLIEYVERRLQLQGKDIVLKLIPLCLIFMAAVILSQFMRNFFQLKLKKWISRWQKKQWVEMLNEKRADSLEEYGEGNYILAFHKSEALEELISLHISIGLSGIMLILAGFYIGIELNWRYLAVMLLIALFLVVSGFLSKPLERKRADINEKEKYSISLMNSMIKGIYIIKSYYMEEKMEKMFGENADNIANLQIRERDYGVFLDVYMQVVRCATMILVPTLTAYLTFKGLMQEGIIITSSYALFYILGHFMSIMESMGGISRAKGDLQLIEAGEELPDKKNVSILKQWDGDILFRNISAEYGDKIVFNNYSITLRKGCVTLLKGESGCGKSTMLKCMAGLKLFSNGELFWGSERIEQDVLSMYIAYVPQESIIFNMTPYENIKLAGTEITDIQIEKVIDEICPEIKQVLKECKNARHLSGGQKQLVGVIRALVSGAPIILMDEPTASMDIKTVGYLMRYLKQNPASKTFLLSSHDIDVQKENFCVYEL